MHKYFHNLILGVSLFPALVVLPAFAEIQQKVGSSENPQTFYVGDEKQSGGLLLVYKMTEGTASYDTEKSVIDVTPSEDNKISAQNFWTSIQSHNPEHIYPLINVKGDKDTVVTLSADEDDWLVVSRFAPLNIGTKENPIGSLSLIDTVLEDGSLVYVTAGNNYADSNKQDLRIYANNISMKAKNADGSAGVALTGNEGHATIVANNNLNIEGNIEAYNTVYGGHANMSFDINQNEGNNAKTTIVGNINAAKGSVVNIGLKGVDSSITGDLLVSAEGTNLPGGNIKLDFGKNGSIEGTLKAQDAGQIDVNADTIKISSTNGHALGVYDDGVINVKGSEIDISSAKRGIAAKGARTGESFAKGAFANIEGDIIKIHSENDIAVMGLQYADVSIKGKDVKISSNTSDDWAAVHSGNNTSAATQEDLEKAARVKIVADNIDISAKTIGVGAMSQGNVELIGNTKISANDVIVARGGAHVDINTTSGKTTQLNGNINFDYDKATSGTKIDAVVNIGLNTRNSYWNGNTYASYGTGKAPDESYMKVNSVSLFMKNGAVWNASKIVDNMSDDTSGEGYVALNNLNINKGFVNIKDTERGIIVENANVANAVFNGGPLNIKNMKITSGENTFNTNVIGVDSGSELVIANGASMDIGTKKINVDTLDLNGTLTARLVSNSDSIFNVGTFKSSENTGKLSLAIEKEGTYNLFGDAKFDKAQQQVTSALFNLDWTTNDGKTVVATKKTVEDIASSNEITSDAANGISHIIDASSLLETSRQMKVLSLKLQEKLAQGDKDSVEHAVAAIHPEKESVVQSVSTSVQNTVVNLASARMVMPGVGRAGGDVRMTTGGTWVQGLFNKSKQGSAFDGRTRGIAVGSDGTFSNHLTLGAGYSFAHSDVSGTARDTDIDSNTIFIYGQYKPSNWYLNAIINYTWSDYSENGTVLDNTSVFSDYTVKSFGGNLATGYNFKTGMTPELGLRYIHISSEDYANSLGITTSMKDSNFMTGMFGAKYAFNVIANKRTKFIPQLNAALKYDFISDSRVATVTIPGVDSYSLDSNRLERIGGEFGIGLGMKYDNLDISVNYDIDVREDYTSQTGLLKFRCNF